jgi:hypothetical protein
LVTTERDVGNGPPEHGIAEELEPLVRQLTRLLGAPGPVREGPIQQGRIGELPTESFDEQRARVGADQDPRRVCT